MRASRTLLRATAVVLGCHLALLVLPADRPPARVASGVGDLLLLLLTVVLVRRAAQEPAVRPWAIPVALGVAMYGVGDVSSAVVDLTHAVPFPSPADAGHLGAYPFLLAGLLVSLREQLRGVRLIVALDGLCGTLAGAALATLVVGPLIDRVWDGSAGAAVTLGYPVCGAVALAAALGVLGVVGSASGRRLLLWAAGSIVLGAGDIGYGYLLASDSVRSAAPFDATGAVGLALVTAGAVEVVRTQRRGLPAARSLLVVAVASLTSVVVLAAAPPWHHDALPSVLALLTLTVCAVRLARAFLQLRELAAIREQALTDELTGIANRRALYGELDRLLGLRRTSDGRDSWHADDGFGLALIDLDHFKEVNDSYGHAAGDELLRAVVERFAGALQELQTPHLLARLGGDEFAVILRDVGSRDAAVACGAALQESLLEPVVLNDVVLHAQASIGMAVAPDHGRNRGDLLFAADTAMYASKSSGEPVCSYSPTGVGDRRMRLEVAEDLYAALERGELTVEYQPILTAAGELVGAEALVRWDHPVRGRLSPAEFLEIAERYRLTPSIATRVLDVALADLARWRSSGADLRMSVNVSALDLRDEGLVAIVAEALLRHGVPPSALLVEVTETAMMRDPQTAQEVMRALHELGVQLAVDDYGTGYSSLEYLLELPIDEIKLDRAFSSRVSTDDRSVAIVRSTVDLTHALGLRMVAEGVEDEPTLVVLRELGCDLVQGWHLAHPMPAAAFEGFVEAGVLDERVVARHRRSTHLTA